MLQVFDLNLNRPATKPKIISIFAKDNILLGINSYQLFTNEEDKKFVDPMYEYLIRDYTLANLEEEIRILYVAMTRAKHLLVLANKNSKFFNNVEFNRNPCFQYFIGNCFFLAQQSCVGA